MHNMILDSLSIISKVHKPSRGPTLNATADLQEEYCSSIVGELQKSNPSQAWATSMTYLSIL